MEPTGSKRPREDDEAAQGQAYPVSQPPPLPSVAHFPPSQAKIVNHASAQNPEPTAVPAPQKQFFGTLGARHVICMVGLPHRGRDYVATELGWYLEFFHGAEVKLFDVAEYADAYGEGSRQQHAQNLFKAMEDFLQDSTAATALNLREEARGDAAKLQMADQGKVAIVLPFRMADTEMRDQRLLERSRNAHEHVWSCSNATDREWVRQRLSMRTACKLMFVELEVTDAGLRKQHLDQLQPENREAFLALEAEHKRAYTPLGRSASGEGALSYLRLKNFRDMETHRMHGYLRMRIAQFLSVLRPRRHTVYLSRHGESTYNVEKKLGGNPGLSPLGQQYAERLGVYAARAIQVDEATQEMVCARLWTSSLIRTDQTAAHIPHPLIVRSSSATGSSAASGGAQAEAGTKVEVEVDEADDGVLACSGGECSTPARHMAPWQQMAQRVYRQLDEIFAGEYDGYTEAQIKQVDPRFSDERKGDKLGMRYPKGESYLDLITRLEPLVHELLAFHEPILIVSHQAVLRVLRAYLLHRPRGDCHAGNIPQHTVMKIVWDGWHFPPKPSPREATMKANWPPPDCEAWQPAMGGEADPAQAVGTEEWVWLGPDTKRSDGQKHI